MMSSLVSLFIHSILPNSTILMYINNAGEEHYHNYAIYNTIRRLFFSVNYMQVTGIVSTSAVSDENEEKVSISCALHRVTNIKLDTVHFRLECKNSTLNEDLQYIHGI